VSSPYNGASVSALFNQRWRSKQHVGNAKPYMKVMVRRGAFVRSYHDDWPNPQFGQVVGKSIRHQFYPVWTPYTDYVELPGVAEVDLDQSFDNNGTTVGTFQVDNVGWVEALNEVGWTNGSGGPAQYHQRQRGYLWPWRGWTPPKRPGSGEKPNQWWDFLSNCQITVWQGYGSNAAVKTFTGLVDSYGASVRPDRLNVSSRDFGGMLSDVDLFGWNKDPKINDPITFIPADYLKLSWAQDMGKQTGWIIINDACDIVRVILRWAGFKEWDIEDSGVNLSVPYSADKSHAYMDVINDIATQLGYQFFMSEPSEDDLSIGVPVFRLPSVLAPERNQPITLRSDDLLTDMQPTHDNKDDRYIIRVRGVVNNKIGVYLDNPNNGGDETSDVMKRVTFTYWPPWSCYVPNLAENFEPWSLDVTYNTGDQVSHDGSVYYCKRDDNRGRDPVTWGLWSGWWQLMGKEGSYGRPGDVCAILKQLTYYNVGDAGVLGFTTIQQCMVACVMIATQIGLARDTAQLQCPGNPAFGLDCFAYVTDVGTGVASRLYITNRKSTMTIGGDGTSQQSSPYSSGASSQSELIWATELGGSLVDNPEMDHIVSDYQKAISGGNVLSDAPPQF